MTEAVVPKIEPKLPYLLLTGADDAAFCERVSATLGEGYRLYGDPAATYNGEQVILAQALVLDIAVDKNGALR